MISASDLRLRNLNPGHVAQDEASQNRASQNSPLPTMHELSSEDPLEPGLPDEFHGLQPQLLAETLSLTDYEPTEMFQSFDLNLYYDPDHTGWYKRPDWFLVVGTTRLYRGTSSRSSYVIWDEQIPPIVVIEFLSPGTEDEDLGQFAGKLPNSKSISKSSLKSSSKARKPPGKFTVYEQILKVPHYLVFNKSTGQLRYFRLINAHYQEQPIAPNPPSIWIPELKIGLGIWHGPYRHLTQNWLRWCDEKGHWLPSETEKERSEKERERAEKEKLAQYLRSIGIDPDHLPTSD